MTTTDTSRPAGARRSPATGIDGRQGRRRLAVRRPGGRDPRAVPAAADRHGAVGQRSPTGTARAARSRRRAGFVGADNYQRLFTEHGLTRQDFMTSHPQQLLLRARRGAGADGARAGPRPGRQPAAAQGPPASSAPRSTSRRSPARWRSALIFLFLFTKARRGQRAARPVRHRRPAVVLRPARDLPPRRPPRPGGTSAARRTR